MCVDYESLIFNEREQYSLTKVEALTRDGEAGRHERERRAGRAEGPGATRHVCERLGLSDERCASTPQSSGPMRGETPDNRGSTVSSVGVVALYAVAVSRGRK